MQKLKNETHIKVLDGWRGVSIVLVLLAHLVPLPGTKMITALTNALNSLAPNLLETNAAKWNFNDAIGILGMVIFFNLSGFLITNYLLEKDATASKFIIRRFFRIAPLFFLYITIVFSIIQPALKVWIANLLFYANLPPKQLIPFHDHLWSICVEVQFYMGITIIFFLFKRKGLLALPLLAMLFTILRVWHKELSSSITYFRIDEILAGCSLSLVLNGKFGSIGNKILLTMKKIPQIPLFLLLLVSSFPQSGEFNYFRPYIAALLIGSTICLQQTKLSKLLTHETLIYLASISYALYIIHLGLTETWLGQGNLTEKYIKRPLLLSVLLIMAHVSTFYYEKLWIELGRKISKRSGS